MNEIESDVNRERLLARTLIDLRETFTRAKMLLPSLSLSEMLTLAGAVEQAKTAGMKTKTEPTPRLTKKSKKAPPALTPGGDIENLPILDSTLTVTIGKTRQHVVSAVARLVVERGPLTVPEIMTAFEEKGWKFNSKSEHTYQVMRGLLVRQAKYFKAIRKDGNVQFALRNGKAKARSGVRVRKETKTALRDQVLRTLSRVKEPITTPALAERLGLSSGQGLVPLLVSLKDHGAVKKIVKDEVTHWNPNRDKLRAYDAERGGAAFTQKQVEVLNGVSHS